ncbi:MAG: metal-dependent transcriptional regulator [Faecalicoccus sp.]|nr:metal-dependent transcriptional regulator [Faecalicoccus sp.]
MKNKESVEMYLKAIYLLREAGVRIHMVDVAAYLGFSKSSVSVAMKKLEKLGLVAISDNKQLSLTEEGEKIARSVVEKSRFFTEGLMALGVPKNVAEQDACRIEHVLSEESFEAMKKFFNQNDLFIN